jgi:3-oxoacyl-[acyl-carrier protein] reductase
MSQKIVVITGTSSGLGFATAQRLISTGYRVVGVARRKVSAADLGVDPSSYDHIEFDLKNISQIPDLGSAIIKQHGKPYALVNNAAIGTDGMLPTMHNTEIEEILDLNVLAPIVLTKYLIRPMLEQRQGRIVNISSIVAKTGYRGLSVYGASKAAMEGFTHSLARDVGPRGITVNCIAPGFVDTEMTASLGDENLERIKRRAALGRFPSADEVAAGIEYLLSPSAAGVTGTTLTIDAGNTA